MRWVITHAISAVKSERLSPDQPRADGQRADYGNRSGPQIRRAVTALVESPQVCSLKFLTCEQRSV